MVRPARSDSSCGRRSVSRRDCDFNGYYRVQDRLSFYFKSPQSAPGLNPEHDLFIQRTKLKSKPSHWMGEVLVTHLGTEYYEE